MCALHNLKFDHIAFTQGPTSLSHYRCVMDKNIWAVTALDETISANISEPFNAAKHLVFFQKLSVRLCIHEELHSRSWDTPYKSLRANRTTSRLATAVPWFRYPSFRRSRCDKSRLGLGRRHQVQTCRSIRVLSWDEQGVCVKLCRYRLHQWRATRKTPQTAATLRPRHSLLVRGTHWLITIAFHHERGFP